METEGSIYGEFKKQRRQTFSFSTTQRYLKQKKCFDKTLLPSVIEIFRHLTSGRRADNENR